MDSIFFNVSNLYFIIFIIFFLGGVVKGAIGIGLPTVTIGLLIFFFDIKESINYLSYQKNFFIEIIGAVIVIVVNKYLSC